MSIAVANYRAACATELDQSKQGVRQEDERVVVTAFLDVCARTLDGYRAALANSQVDEIRRIGDRLRSAARTLGIGPPATEEAPEQRGRTDRCCAFHSLGELYDELECLSRGLQVLSSES